MKTKFNMKSFWYTNLAAGITLAVGILLVIFPNIVEITCLAASVIVALLGLGLIVAFFIRPQERRENEHLAYAIFFLVAGVLLGLAARILPIIVPIFFGLWMLLTALSGMYRNFCMRTLLPHWWIGLLLCLACGVLGVVVMLHPTKALESAVRFAGIMLIIHAVLRLTSAMLGRKGYIAGEDADVIEGKVIETTIKE